MSESMANTEPVSGGNAGTVASAPWDACAWEKIKPFAVSGGQPSAWAHVNLLIQAMASTAPANMNPTMLNGGQHYSLMPDSANKWF